VALLKVLHLQNKQQLTANYRRLSCSPKRVKWRQLKPGCRLLGRGHLWPLRWLRRALFVISGRRGVALTGAGSRCRLWFRVVAEVGCRNEALVVLHDHLGVLTHAGALCALRAGFALGTRRSQVAWRALRAVFARVTFSKPTPHC